MRNRREQAGFEDDQKKDLDSTDEAEDEDDFGHEENKQCDNFRSARETTDDHDRTVELDGSSDEEQHKQGV